MEPSLLEHLNKRLVRVHDFDASAVQNLEDFRTAFPGRVYSGYSNIYLDDRVSRQYISTSKLSRVIELMTASALHS